MTQPFFSILIPTKNRSHIVPSAIVSALDQDFEDYEVVLVDNDDTQATQEACRKFTSPHFRYVRTGGLTMADNWENAYRVARGTYRLLLEDKSVLKPRALSKIFSLLKAAPAPVVSWPQDLFNDVTVPHTVARGPATRGYRLMQSDAILKSFLTERRGMAENYLPRGLNSAIHVDLYQTICKGPIGRLCAPVSPDYTMAFLQLNYADHLLNIEDCLTVYGSCKMSHGWATTKQVISNQYLKSDFGLNSYDEYWHPRIPARVFITAAYTFNDFLSIQDQVPGRLKAHTLSPRQFFIETARDITMVEAAGVDMQAVRHVWDEGIRRQPKPLRTQICAQMDREAGVPTSKRRVFEATGLGSLWRKGKSWFGWKPPVDNPSHDGTPHLSPIDYIHWEKVETAGSV